MKCVILQPSYIPWRGYFHQIQKADVFVFYDDAQFDHGGWRNRNRVKTSQGARWLTVPVRHRGEQEIRSVEICWKTAWNKKHWETIRQSYSRAPYFKAYADLLERAFRARPTLLADFAIDLTRTLAEALGISGTRFVRSSDLGGVGRKTDRLIDLLSRLGATHYISGPLARDYLEPHKFASAGITLEYMRYEYPEYPQLHPPFDPQVSVIDLLLTTGPAAGSYIWQTPESPARI